MAGRALGSFNFGVENDASQRGQGVLAETTVLTWLGAPKPGGAPSPPGLHKKLLLSKFYHPPPFQGELPRIRASKTAAPVRILPPPPPREASKELLLSKLHTAKLELGAPHVLESAGILGLRAPVA